MPASILWVAIVSGVVVLGGAHLVIWLIIRSHRKADSAPGDGER